jgi:elongation factor Ts
MAEISAEAVKQLRERTDLPLMECKRALMEANGDQEQAMKILKERVKGWKEKMVDRVASEGRVATLSKPDGSACVMVEVQCETAPVAKNEDFLFLCDQLCKQLLNGPGAANPEELLTQQCPDKAGTSLADLYDSVLNKIREKIVVARVLKVAGPAGAYTHHDGKLGVVFQASGAGKNAEILRDVAIHVAAMKPKVCLPEEMDQSVVTAERAKLVDEAKKSGKPDNIVEKIVDGKMRTFFNNEGVLVAQPFVKDEAKTVEQALAAAGYKAVGFTRWRIGN